MKADVLSEFPTIKVCTHYKYNGEIIDYLPYNIEGDKIEPIYKEFTCWKEDLTGITEMSDLPIELTDYVEYLENAHYNCFCRAWQNSNNTQQQITKQPRKRGFFYD